MEGEVVARPPAYNTPDFLIYPSEVVIKTLQFVIYVYSQDCKVIIPG